MGYFMDAFYRIYVRFENNEESSKSIARYVIGLSYAI
jgi:hypothetical protein